MFYGVQSEFRNVSFEKNEFKRKVRVTVISIRQ